MEAPTIRTERLLLRLPELSDAAEVQRLAGDREVAATTRRIPHPYADGMAEKWIGIARDAFQRQSEISFVIVRLADEQLVGGIGLILNREDERAELGYWIGRPYWGHGYATEAGQALLRYGFETYRVNRIHAGLFARNAASARVLEKLGMTCEGRLAQHYKKWDVFEDAGQYGILRDTWLKLSGKTSSAK